MQRLLMKTIEFSLFSDRLGKTKNVGFSPCRSMNSIVLIVRKLVSFWCVPTIGAMNHARIAARINY